MLDLKKTSKRDLAKNIETQPEHKRDLSLLILIVVVYAAFCALLGCIAGIADTENTSKQNSNYFELYTARSNITLMRTIPELPHYEDASFEVELEEEETPL